MNASPADALEAVACSLFGEVSDIGQGAPRYRMADWLEDLGASAATPGGGE